MESGTIVQPVLSVQDEPQPDMLPPIGQQEESSTLNETEGSGDESNSPDETEGSDVKSSTPNETEDSGEESNEPNVTEGSDDESNEPNVIDAAKELIKKVADQLNNDSGEPIQK